jgi:hypothetical protein
VHGEIEYHTPGWKVKFTPNFHVTSPQVLRGKELQLLRGEDGETGLSYNIKYTRHFFIYGKAPTTPKLLLQLEVLTILEFVFYSFVQSLRGSKGERVQGRVEG